MTGRLAMIAILAGALLGQAWQLSKELEEERRLRARDARDAVKAFDRLRDDFDELQNRQQGNVTAVPDPVDEPPAAA